LTINLKGEHIVKIVDVSLPLTNDIPAWPGSIGFVLTWVDRMEAGQSCNNSQIACDTHIGTHVDAPLHFVKNGQSVDLIPPDLLIGPCHVVYLPGLTQINAETLTSLQLATDTRRLLLKTHNSNLWLATGKNLRKTMFISLKAAYGGSFSAEFHWWVSTTFPSAVSAMVLKPTRSCWKQGLLSSRA